ncbi:MAG: hypothetical protein QHH13_06360 [Melioribacter sp.]|uniref:hypothetical protein n=1 Tax=Rosettibacter primus TaxID=3111523 RepID=UPI00247C8B51|nr:hypothetical protein [Melioribacter sp.]
MKNFIFVLALLFIITACDKNENSPTEPGQDSNITPQIQSILFTGPSKTNTDPTFHAQAASSFATSFNSMFLFASSFSMTPAQKNGNIWKWVIQQVNLTITVETEKKSDGSYNWKCTYNGTDNYGNQFNNWVVWKGIVSADGKTGNWEFYDSDSKTIENKFSYAVDSQGKKTGTIEYYNNGKVIQRIILINNPDGSGSLDLYEEYTSGITSGLYKSMHIEWKADGSGSWQEFDEKGFVSDSGSWT